MEELEPLKIRELLDKYQIRPTKGLGQNFLVDESTLARVVAAAEIGQADAVLEVGPGLGSLTRHLAQAAKRVVAVELDRNMLPALREVLKPYSNVEIVQADILEINIADHLKEPGYLVVANIPYYITSALLRHLLETSVPPKRLVLTVQKEVAQRICAEQGNLNLLALSVQVYGRPQIVSTIPAGAFFPSPKIDSAIVRVDLFSNPVIEKGRLDLFFQLAKAGFSQKRKTLRNALSAGMAWSKEDAEEHLAKARIDPQRRAQTLSLAEWGKLVEILLGLKGIFFR